MDASKIWMLGDFIGTNKVLFRIPVYQRNYDWKQENCKCLFNDICDIISNKSSHFIGTICSKIEGRNTRVFMIL